MDNPNGPEPPSPLADDHPFTQTLRFVEVARTVAASGFGIDELDYLLRAAVRSGRAVRPPTRARCWRWSWTSAARSRACAPRTPRPPIPPPSTTRRCARSSRIVLPAADVETFMAMWRGTIQYQASEPNVTPGGQLDPAHLPAGVAVAYDAGAQVQHLTFTGVLLDSSALAPSPGLLRTLLDHVQEKGKAFLRDRLAGLLEAADLAVIFPPPQAQPDVAARRERMAGGLFRFVRERLMRELVVASRAAALDAPRGLAEALISDESLLPGPLLDDFAAAGDAGVSATFYGSDDASGAPLAGQDIPDADTTAKPAGTHSARLEGVLAVQRTATYTFSMLADDAAARAQLRFSHLPDPIATASADVELKAGVPYGFTLDVGKLAASDVRLHVAGEVAAGGAAEPPGAAPHGGG